MIVAGAVIQEPGAILLPARVLVGIGTRGSSLRREPKRFIGVLRLERAGVVAQGHRRAQRIGQERAHAHAIGAREELINPQAGQQIRRDRGAVLLLHGVEAVIEKVGGGALHGFAGAAAKGIVGERGGKAGGRDAGQLVAHVPRVGRGAAGIRYRRQVAVKVIRLRIGPECQLLIVGIVSRRGERGR